MAAVHGSHYAVRLYNCYMPVIAMITGAQSQRTQRWRGGTYAAMATQFLPVIATIAAPFNSKIDCSDTKTTIVNASQATNKDATAVVIAVRGSGAVR